MLIAIAPVKKTNVSYFYLVGYNFSSSNKEYTGGGLTLEN